MDNLIFQAYGPLVGVSSAIGILALWIWITPYKPFGFNLAMFVLGVLLNLGGTLISWFLWII